MAKLFDLFGIDAPEFEQFCELDVFTLPCGQRAAHFLAAHIADHIVECSQQDSAQYDGIVAVCHVGAEDLAAWLVSNGHALAYRKYSDDYVADEREPIRMRSGLWRWPRSFVPPWQWREQHTYVSATASFDDRLRAPIRKVIELLVAMDYHQLAEFGYEGNLVRQAHIEKLEQTIEQYRHSLVMPPQEGFERMKATEIPNRSPRRWLVEMPLWTAEDGESKLLLTVGLIKRDEQFDIDFFDVSAR